MKPVGQEPDLPKNPTGGKGGRQRGDGKGAAKRKTKVKEHPWIWD